DLPRGVSAHTSAEWLVVKHLRLTITPATARVGAPSSMVGARRLVEAARLHLPVPGELFHDEVDEPDLFHAEACLVHVLGERLLSGLSVQPHQGADEEAEATGL